MTQEALKLALEGLEEWRFGGDPRAADKYITAIKEALAQTQEPVAWTLANKVRQDLDQQSCPDAFMRIAVESIVKHHPPQRTWVGLTDEEVRKICVNEWGGYEQCRAIEAKLKEKNT